jgi:uncharacterized protein YqhQ
VREPLSDEDVRRIARETARELVRQVLGIGLVLVFSVMAFMLLPVFVVMTVNSFAPPLGQNASPLAGTLSALAVLLVIFVLVRSWATLRHR